MILPISYPETSGRTLEEIQEIFDGPNAVSALADDELEHHSNAMMQDMKKEGGIEQLEYAGKQ